MGKYMFHTSYTGKGLVGLLKEGGSRRRAALTQTIEAMGGSVEGLYYAFGETDLYIICDLPDDASATWAVGGGVRLPRAGARGSDEKRGAPPKRRAPVECG